MIIYWQKSPFIKENNKRHEEIKTKLRSKTEKLKEATVLICEGLEINKDLHEAYFQSEKLCKRFERVVQDVLHRDQMIRKLKIEVHRLRFFMETSE